MIGAVVLLAASLSGQVARGAFEVRNQSANEDVFVWVSVTQTGAFLYNKEAIVLRPRQSIRLNLPADKYGVHFRTRSNSTLVLKRQLASGEVDRLRVLDPPPPPSGGPTPSVQIRVQEVHDDYGNVESMTPPPMELPRPGR